MSVYDPDYIIEMIQGPEGLALYINNYRIAGPKPWGGGTVVKTWKTKKRDITAALSRPQQHAQAPR